MARRWTPEQDWVPGRIEEDRRVEMVERRGIWRHRRRSPWLRRFLCMLVHSSHGWRRGVCGRCGTDHWPVLEDLR